MARRSVRSTQSYGVDPDDDFGASISQVTPIRDSYRDSYRASRTSEPVRNSYRASRTSEPVRGSQADEIFRNSYRGSVASEAIPVELTDEELAAQLQQQLNADDPSTPGAVTIHTLHDELEDGRLAQELLDQEIAELEQRRITGLQGTRAGSVDHSLDYMRPRNFKPVFCAVAALVCSMVMLIEIGENGWKVESFNTNPTVGPAPAVLVQMGAKRTDLITEKGDWWRLFTPMVLHAGLIHLLFNMWGLYNVGVPAEREFGSLRIGIIFFISGFCGVLLSAIFVPLLVSVGASGAIFGLFGAAWADLIQNWSLYRDKAWGAFCQLLFSTVINLTIGLMPYLDNFAHVGGFLAGFILGLTLLVQTRYTHHGERKGRRNYQLLLQALSVIVLPIIVVIMLLVLYFNVDAQDWCPSCAYISCVPMPPGAEPENLWWDCNPCAQFNIEGTPIGNNGTFELTCPGGNTVIPDILDTDLTAPDLLRYCSLVCDV